MDRSSSPEVGVDLKDAVLRLSHLLPPRERVALVLSEAFDLSAPEIAAIIESSEGAVKAALHRARARLSGARDTGSPSLLKASPTARARIDAFVAALNRRDLDGVANLLLENASGVVYGCVQEFSREEIKKGSMFYTVNTPDGKPQPIPFPKAERRELFGQDVLVIWSDEKTLDDVMRFKVEEGELGGFISYYFCPTVLEEISRTLGSGFKSHGYGPPKKSS